MRGLSGFCREARAGEGEGRPCAEVLQREEGGVFGSPARREGSGADILVEFGGSLLDLAGLKLDLEEVLGRGQFSPHALVSYLLML